MTDDQLAATALSAMPSQPDLVMLGNTVGPGGNVARIATLGTGWEATGAVTLNAQCGSSLLAVGQAAAHATMTGQTVVAGGVESPSTAWPDGQRTQAAFAPQGFPDPDMTYAADQLAVDYGISRQTQEHYAVTSHRRALANWSEFLVGGRDDDGPRDVRKLVSRLRTVTDHPEGHRHRVDGGAHCRRRRRSSWHPNLMLIISAEILDYRLSVPTLPCPASQQPQPSKPY